MQRNLWQEVNNLIKTNNFFRLAGQTFGILFISVGICAFIGPIVNLIIDHSFQGSPTGYLVIFLSGSVTSIIAFIIIATYKK
jgi:ABC-type sugar transport system permease subunit